MYFCHRVNGSSGAGEAVAPYRQWQLLACWPPLGTVVGGLDGGDSSALASPATLLAPGNSVSRMGNRGCTWTTPLWFRHPRVIWEQLALCRPRISASPHLPSACHLTPTRSFPGWPHGLLYNKNPFPEFNEKEACSESVELCMLHFHFHGAMSMIYSNLSQCHLGKICKSMSSRP